MKTLFNKKILIFLVTIIPFIGHTVTLSAKSLEVAFFLHLHSIYLLQRIRSSIIMGFLVL